LRTVQRRLPSGFTKTIAPEIRQTNRKPYRKDPVDMHMKKHSGRTSRAIGGGILDQKRIVINLREAARRMAREKACRMAEYHRNCHRASRKKMSALL